MERLLRLWYFVFWNTLPGNKKGESKRVLGFWNWVHNKVSLIDGQIFFLSLNILKGEHVNIMCNQM